MATRVEESFAFQGGTVDRSGKYPVIKNVLLCGRESKWGRRYANECFAGDRIKVYENAPVFLDHTNDKGSRKYGDHFGWVEPGSVRHNADGLPVGDIGCKPTHEHLESVLWDVQNRPQNCMMSHVADIESVPVAGGLREVRECKHIASVDIVTSGATTTGMFTSEGFDGQRPTGPETASEVMHRLSCELRGLPCPPARPTRSRSREGAPSRGAVSGSDEMPIEIMRRLAAEARGGGTSAAVSTIYASL